MSKELDAARREYLKRLAEDFKATTHDRLIDLIPNAINDLDTFSNRELREVIAEIIRDGKARNIASVGAPDLREKIG